MSLKPAEINVDQTVQLVSDQYEVALNGAEAFVTRGALSPATIETGFLDDDLDESFLTNMANGIIDEVELRVDPDAQHSVVRGRDAAAYAIESSVYVTFDVNGLAQKAQDQMESIPGFPSLPVTPGVTVPIILSGYYTASSVAAKLCSLVGLSCVYGAPDYVLRESMTVNGSVASALQSLIEPFNHFEPSKIDIWTEGTTVIIRPRSTAGPGIALDAHDTRITDLSIRARSLGAIRVLRLSGSTTGSHEEGVAITGFEDTESVDEMEQDGVVVSRIITREHIRSIDHAVFSSTKETWEWDSDLNGLRLVAQETMTSDWDEAEVVFPNTLVNSPKEHQRIIVRQSFDGGELKNDTLTGISHHYDDDGYLKAQNTRTDSWDEDAADGAGAFTPSESETKTYRRSSSGSYQITSTQFGADGTPGPTRRTTANGTPPGGPGRGVGSNGSSASTTPVVYATVISAAPGAKDVSISNKNLLLEHLQIIAAQAAAASGATEVEISFTAAGMPWLHRGQLIELTGLEDDLGYDIPLQTALVTETKLEYRESSDAPTYLSHVRACFWDRSL